MERCPICRKDFTKQEVVVHAPECLKKSEAGDMENTDSECNSEYNSEYNSGESDGECDGKLASPFDYEQLSDEEEEEPKGDMEAHEEDEPETQTKTEKCVTAKVKPKVKAKPKPKTKTKAKVKAAMKLKETGKKRLKVKKMTVHEQNHSVMDDDAICQEEDEPVAVGPKAKKPTSKSRDALIAYKCKYCPFNAAWKSNTDRHEITCKMRKVVEEQQREAKLQRSIDKRDGRIEMLQAQVDELKEANALMKGELKGIRACISGGDVVGSKTRGRR